MTDRIRRQPIQENFARRIENLPLPADKVTRSRQYELQGMVCRLHGDVGQPEFEV